MPWKETCAVDQRQAFIDDVLLGDLSKSELCRKHDISRPTGDKWIERFVKNGKAGLVDLACSPHNHPNQVDDEVAEMLLALRRGHMTWGPKKLKAYLERRSPAMDWPWPSTIGELLKRHGLSVGRCWRRRTPTYTQPFAGCDEPNRTWCVDFKGQFQTGQSVCYPLTMTDAFSRYLLRCQGMPHPRTAPTRSIFESAFREYGLPVAIRSDNGPPFASRSIGGLSRLSAWWIKLGIVPERIKPGHPEQNGRHERMHLTLKKETASPPGSSLRGQQLRFDAFRQEYNEQRPHESLGQRTPAEHYQASPRRYPSRLAGPEYGDDAVVRSVRKGGMIKWHGQLVYLGQALAGEPVGLEPIGDGYWLACFYKMRLGVLDERRRKVWNMETATRKGWGAADVLPSPFRCASGTGQNAEV